MVGVAGNGISVTSWGWCDDDGRTCLADAATHRVWKVSHDGNHVGFLAMPVDTDTAQVWAMAARGVGL